jgi:hypothetical protein
MEVKRGCLLHTNTCVLAELQRLRLGVMWVSYRIWQPRQLPEATLHCVCPWCAVPGVVDLPESNLLPFRLAIAATKAAAGQAANCEQTLVPSNRPHGVLPLRNPSPFPSVFAAVLERLSGQYNTPACLPWLLSRQLSLVLRRQHLHHGGSSRSNQREAAGRLAREWQQLSRRAHRLPARPRCRQERRGARPPCTTSPPLLSLAF